MAKQKDLNDALDLLTAWVATMRECPQELLAGVLKELTKQTDNYLSHHPPRGKVTFEVTTLEPPS